MFANTNILEISSNVITVGRLILGKPEIIEKVLITLEIRNVMHAPVNTSKGSGGGGEELFLSQNDSLLNS